MLAGVADAIPKSGEGEVEMIRMLKSTKDSAVKARTQAVNQMKALVVTAPAELREALDGLTTSALITRCKSFRPGHLDHPRRPRSTLFASLPAVTVNSVKRFNSWRANWNGSPERQRPHWLTPSAWDPIPPRPF